MISRAPTAAETTAPETSFYAEVLRAIRKLRIPVRVGGTCAVNIYVGMARDTKDIDLFCKPGDYPRLLSHLADAGFETEVEDERWVAKICRGPHFCDVVFGSANMVAPITDQWMIESHPATLFGVRTALLAPTELIWSKAFIMDRVKFDGGDIAHLILRQHGNIDWERLLAHMDQHWEVLLMHILAFRYIYPSERNSVPSWLTDELLARLHAQLRLPESNKRVCRGRIFSRDDYMIDIHEWGFADLVGEHWRPETPP